MTFNLIENMILNQWEQAGGIYSQAAKLIKAEMELEGKTSTHDPRRTRSEPGTHQGNRST